MEKKRDVKSFPYHGDANSLWEWKKVVSPWRAFKNLMVIGFCKRVPSLRLKNALLRSLGMKIGKNVSIAYGVMFDFLFPELIEIGDNTIIGYGTTVLCHEFLIKEHRTGKVRIGKECMIGALSLVMPGVKVGDHATVAAYSLVNRDVPSGAFYGGVPARKIG